MSDILAPQFSKDYVPDNAQEGSFVPLNTSTMTAYPSSGWGKYARLVYVIGGSVATTSVQPTAFTAPHPSSISIGAQRTPSIKVATETGNIEAGKKFIEFTFSKDFDGTILGASFNGSEDTTYTLTAQDNDTFSEIPYTVTSGNIRITTF